MGRPTQKFVTANKDKLDKISEEHKYLIEDFLIYCKAEGKSPKTIINYRSDLNIFFCWYEDGGESLCGEKCHQYCVARRNDSIG